jgi:hypothetical protein
VCIYILFNFTNSLGIVITDLIIFPQIYGLNLLITLFGFVAELIDFHFYRSPAAESVF